MALLRPRRYGILGHHMRPILERKDWSWITYAAADGVPWRSLMVSLVIGTVLNLINQGDVLLAGRPLDYGKVVLTYVVPYLVATYGAVTARLAAERRRGRDRRNTR